MMGPAPFEETPKLARSLLAAGKDTPGSTVHRKWGLMGHRTCLHPWSPASSFQNLEKACRLWCPVTATRTQTETTGNHRRRLLPVLPAPNSGSLPLTPARALSRQLLGLRGT